MKSIHDEFVNFIKINMNLFEVYDQDAYKFFFKTKIQELPHKFNYKTYWGNSENVKIIHFHGPKPFHKDTWKNENYPQILKGLITPYFFESTDKFFSLLNELY
jgi:lipopolysaccharide biosynthesis glycosyltransferase